MASARLDPYLYAHVDLYWLPLGAGGARCVRFNGRLFEAITARYQHRGAEDLYHSALQVRRGGDRYVIEMAPVWSLNAPVRGVVCEGAVGLPWLGRSRMFRYEVRCWRDGVIPDLAEAVASPQRLSTDPVLAQRVLDLAPTFPTATWGRDELHAGDMWNSNSLISWLLMRSGHQAELVKFPPRGRAPGWSAGLVVAARQEAAAPVAVAPVTWPMTAQCRPSEADDLMRVLGRSDCHYRGIVCAPRSRPAAAVRGVPIGIRGRYRSWSRRRVK
jgi:hypothetical protein